MRNEVVPLAIDPTPLVTQISFSVPLNSLKIPPKLILNNLFIHVEDRERHIGVIQDFEKNYSTKKYISV